MKQKQGKKEEKENQIKGKYKQVRRMKEWSQEKDEDKNELEKKEEKGKWKPSKRRMKTKKMKL